MRQQTVPGLDDATTVAAVTALGVQHAALPADAPGVAAELSPAIGELLDLIQRGLGLAMAGPAANASILPDRLPAAAFGLAVPDQAAAPEPGFEILPLAAESSPSLSLDERDLFGGLGEVTPGAVDEAGVSALFRGFQLDLFGDEVPTLPGLGLGTDPLPGPLTPPDFAPGKVTMFEGVSELDLTGDVAAALIDENGQLLIDGDGDDVVLLRDGWTMIGSGPEADGYTYYLHDDSGQAVGIRGADVLLL